MRLTIRLLGLDLLDVEVNADAPSSALEDQGADNPGDCTSYPMGFTAHMPKPHEAETPDRDW